MEERKIRSFVQLDVWKEAHKLVLSVYKITDLFPAKERFGLISQMRRAALSITSNIAEGFGRYSYKDNIRFYYLAAGSLTELQNQFILAKDLLYIDQKNFNILAERSVIVYKLINASIRFLRNKNNTTRY